MAHYLFQVAYTSEAWTALIRNPHDRLDAIRPIVERMGGSFESAYFAFGEYDIVGVIQMPSNVDMAAFSLAVSAGGACRAIKTTPLMTTLEGLEAMRKAAAVAYVPPGGRTASV
jgi:uncharacterized protein with GYD domain